MDTWNGTRLTLKGKLLHLLPDAHMGRSFVHDVPLHRRGEREASVLQDFRTRLWGTITDRPDFHICVGDLFDKASVPASVVLEAAETYRKATHRNAHTRFVVYAGNHDLSRDLEARTSFDLFAAIVGDRVTIIREHPEIISAHGLRLGFVPWNPRIAPHDAVAEFEDQGLDAVFGHWDMIAPGEDKSNLIPVEALQRVTPLVVTGHDHRCRAEKRGDLDVLVTGSMQPYSHSEDAAGALYVSFTLEQFLATDPATLRDKCVRVLVPQGTDAPEPVDALQFKIVRAASEKTEINVDYSAGLDMSALMATTFQEFNVGASLVEQIMQKYRSC
jgi:predicted phosphodiesterase